MFCLRLHSIICSYAHVRGILMEIKHINRFKLSKSRPALCLLPSCCGGVLDYIRASPSSSLFPPVSPFSPCSWPTLVFSFQLHQPCLLGVIAGSPPLFPPLLPPHPVSQLTCVSVIVHIWERLSRSRSVCKKHSQKTRGP